MESIGSRIKSVRESKGISIGQAQKDTRISSRILSAIEGDRAHEIISGPLYVKSFIKKYADYLGLDGRSLAESYTGEKPRSREQVSVMNKEKKPVELPVKKIIYIAAAILIILLGIKLILFAGSKTIAFFKSRPKIERKAVAAKTKPEQKKPVAIITKSSFPPIIKGENLTLSLKTRADVYLKLTSDGAIIYDGMLRRGSSEKWEAKESFEISTSRAEVLAVDLNGTSLGPLGKGVIKDLKLPK